MENKRNKTVSRRLPPFDGQIFALYLVGYAICRFIVEFFRGDYPADHIHAGFFTSAQLLSAPILLAGVALWFWGAPGGECETRIADRMEKTSNIQHPTSNIQPIFIAGPTAVGKSAIALALAEKIGGEIISVDSMQVYRGLDIGTAKPSSAERARVPHHLIDIRDLREAFDAAQFVRLAEAAVAEIQARGQSPDFLRRHRALFQGVSRRPRCRAARRSRNARRTRSHAAGNIAGRIAQPRSGDVMKRLTGKIRAASSAPWK